MQDNDLPQIGTPMQTDETRALVKPWADYHGDLPDYDHPLRCVFESGVQYTIELLAKELKVTDWTPCDGTEEYDGDLGGTLMNIVLAAMPKDEHGDPVYPRDLPAFAAPPAVQREGEMAARLKVNAIIAKHFAPLIDNLGDAIRAGNQACTEIIAALSSPTLHPSDREAIARIIAPSAWQLVDHLRKQVNRPDLEDRVPGLTAPSLAKADAILALSGSLAPEGGEHPLARMVALDEEIEAEHPGWMTGIATEKGETK